MRRTGRLDRGDLVELAGPGRDPRRYAANQIWTELMAMARELLAWVQMLALPGKVRRWEPKHLRLRIFTRGWTHHPRRPPATAPPHRTLALGYQIATAFTASNTWHLADQPRHSCGQEGTNGPMEPRPPGATAGAQGSASRRKRLPVTASGHQTKIIKRFEISEVLRGIGRSESRKCVPFRRSGSR